MTGQQEHRGKVCRVAGLSGWKTMGVRDPDGDREPGKKGRSGRKRFTLVWAYLVGGQVGISM